MRTCDQCQCNNSKLHESLHPIKVKGEAWHQVGMDLIGPLQETSCGNKYIMTLTDYYTKWAEAAPLKDKTAVSVVNILFSVCKSSVSQYLFYLHACLFIFFTIRYFVVLVVPRSLYKTRVGSSSTSCLIASSKNPTRSTELQVPTIHKLEINSCVRICHNDIYTCITYVQD